MQLKKLASLSLFTALALIIFALESLIPSMIPIPGVKLGLANIITLVLLRNYTAKETLLVLLMRIFLSGFFYGQAISLLYSLCGGLFCYIIMYLLNRLFNGHYIFITSMAGGLFHNLGQLAIAFVVTGTMGIMALLPFLIISGILTGLFTGLCAHFAQVYLIPVIKYYS